MPADEPNIDYWSEDGGAESSGGDATAAQQLVAEPAQIIAPAVVALQEQAEEQPPDSISSILVPALVALRLCAGSLSARPSPSKYAAREQPHFGRSY